MYRARGGLASVGELFDELVIEDFVCGCGLNDLEKEFAGRLGLFNTRGKFMRRGQAVRTAVAATEVIVILLDGVVRGCVQWSRNGGLLLVLDWDSS